MDDNVVSPLPPHLKYSTVVRDAMSRVAVEKTRFEQPGTPVWWCSEARRCRLQSSLGRSEWVPNLLLLAVMCFLAPGVTNKPPMTQQAQGRSFWPHVPLQAVQALRKFAPQPNAKRGGGKHLELSRPHSGRVLILHIQQNRPGQGSLDTAQISCRRSIICHACDREPEPDPVPVVVHEEMRGCWPSNPLHT